jgi:hypothetical protein
VFIALCLLIPFLSSCESSNERDCEVNKYGTIQISNSSSNPYDIWIDGVFQGTINGKNISTQIKVDEGDNHKLYAKQVSGYLLYPTEKTEYLSVIRCSNYSWMIP